MPVSVSLPVRGFVVNGNKLPNEFSVQEPMLTGKYLTNAWISESLIFTFTHTNLNKKDLCGTSKSNCLKALKSIH